MGSSPRMRGAPRTAGCTGVTGRIIPADAGSTRPCPWPRSPKEDHPRGCGEHYRPLKLVEDLTGSSPRMRGARTFSPAATSSGRIIPADAGSTCMARGIRYGCGDHPRGCGEHWNLPDGGCRKSGSSPRMRGAHMFGAAADGSTGIIPADAGSTNTATMQASSGRDHPRGCGEHTLSPSWEGRF